MDRIDVNGNYEPGNIRWADQQTQRCNQRGAVAIIEAAKSKARLQELEKRIQDLESLLSYYTNESQYNNMSELQ